MHHALRLGRLQWHRRDSRTGNARRRSCVHPRAPLLCAIGRDGGPRKSGEDRSCHSAHVNYKKELAGGDETGQFYTLHVRRCTLCVSSDSVCVCVCVCARAFGPNSTFCGGGYLRLYRRMGLRSCTWEVMIPIHSREICSMSRRRARQSTACRSRRCPLTVTSCSTLTRPRRYGEWQLYCFSPEATFLNPRP